MPIISDLADDEPFTPLHNSVLQNDRLSLKAKGLLTQLLSHPDDWSIYINQLIKETDNGRDAVRSALAELIEVGYVLRKDPRNQHGQFQGTTFLVLHKPVEEYDLADLEQRMAEHGFADAGFGDAGESDAEGPGSTRSQNEQSTESTPTGTAPMRDNKQPRNADVVDENPPDPPVDDPQDDELFNRLVELGIGEPTARTFTQDPRKRELLEKWIDALEWEVNDNGKGTGFVVSMLKRESYDPTNYEHAQDESRPRRHDPDWAICEGDPEDGVDWDAV